MDLVKRILDTKGRGKLFASWLFYYVYVSSWMKARVLVVNVLSAPRDVPSESHLVAAKVHINILQRRMKK